MNLDWAAETPFDWQSSSNRNRLQRLTTSLFWRGAEQFKKLHLRVNRASQLQNANIAAGAKQAAEKGITPGKTSSKAPLRG